MPTLQLTFSTPINTSVQIGDMVYYVPTNTSGTFDVAPLINATEIGEVTAITNQDGALDVTTNPITMNVFDPTGPINQPSIGDFIMFSKNRAVNTSGIIGYYADIKLVNHTTSKAEMFSIASGVIESSK